MSEGTRLSTVLVNAEVLYEEGCRLAQQWNFPRAFDKIKMAGERLAQEGHTKTRDHALLAVDIANASAWLHSFGADVSLEVATYASASEGAMASLGEAANDRKALRAKLLYDYIEAEAYRVDDSMANRSQAIGMYEALVKFAEKHFSDDFEIALPYFGLGLSHMDPYNGSLDKAETALRNAFDAVAAHEPQEGAEIIGALITKPTIANKLAECLVIRCAQEDTNRNEEIENLLAMALEERGYDYDKMIGLRMGGQPDADKVFHPEVPEILETKVDAKLLKLKFMQMRGEEGRNTIKKEDREAIMKVALSARGGCFVLQQDFNIKDDHISAKRIEIKHKLADAVFELTRQRDINLGDPKYDWRDGARADAAKALIPAVVNAAIFGQTSLLNQVIQDHEEGLDAFGDGASAQLKEVAAELGGVAAGPGSAELQQGS